MTKVIDQKTGQGCGKKDFYVYAWERPDTKEVFYIGKGRGVRAHRLKIHNPFFMRVYERLKNDGVDPRVYNIAEGLSEVEAFEIETREIARFGRRNIGKGTLTNLTDGGEGSSGFVFPATRKKKMSLIMTERLQDEELRAVWSAAQVKRYADPEQRKMASEISTQRYKDPEARRRQSDALIGRPKTPEHVEAVASALRQRWESGEMGALIRAGIVAAPPGKANSSGYKGVSFDKQSGKWLAQIQVEKKTKHLGRHLTREAAAEAYDRAARMYFGDNAYQNFPVTLDAA
ncbi:GIY-YIG nuclease family protein [Devosia elaeis]|uniref:AP2/ERF domain-containing protein n=1 Tax=Devosia elaeis TaxID=1770058 RepID=A0A178I0A7_9HYPH|nr:GIY-YIG nuclease family protein [Devosia elaeis]OAM77716.1 hypothetical protein A3840_08805 [Devosia elaeis]